MNELALNQKPPANRSTTAATKASVLKHNALIVGIALAAMWGLEIIDAIAGQALNSWGILPREASGLIGIPLAPLLHGDFGHLAANTVPFAVLAFFTLLRGVKTFALVTAFSVVVGGLLVWLMGASAYHIGASGLIFGYFGYLLAAGFFERSFKSILLAVLVGLLYGGMIFGVMPGRPGVSWEGHLFGAVAGAAFAWLSIGRLKAKAAKKA
jgi:membrane associated rhomboid family serine protease